MLVVFLSNSLNFDELETHIYSTIIEEKKNPGSLKQSACDLITGILKYNYMRKIDSEKTHLLRLYLWIELKYNAKKFKFSHM